jgi:chitinase
MVSFDDERAFAAKGKFIKDYGIAGFATWHTAGDYNNILTDAIRKNMGL